MPEHCHSLSTATNVETFGGKACNLARAQQLGFPVPHTLVIDRVALQLFLTASGFEAPVRAYLASAVHGTSSELNESYRRLVDMIRLGSVPDELRREIGQVATDMLTASPCGLAIRSSAVSEDSQRASFAGVLESFVGVMTVDDVLEKMVSCWGSSATSKVCSVGRPKGRRKVGGKGASSEVASTTTRVKLKKLMRFIR